MNAVFTLRQDSGRFLEIGDQLVDTDTLRVLTRPEGTRLTPKAAAVLLQLARNSGRTLSRDDLLDEVWKGTCPTPDVLTQAVKDLRRALGDDLQSPRYIETLPRLGYRLVAPARFVERDMREALPPDAPATPASQRPSPPLQSSGRRWVPWLLVFGALCAGAVVTARVVSSRAQAPAAVEGARWQVDQRRSLTSDPGAELLPRISPDGLRVAYSVGEDSPAGSRIVTRGLDQSRERRLTKDDAGEECYPVWSPDGSAIAFMRHTEGQCRIMLESAFGGPEREIAACAANTLDYFSWTPGADRLVMTSPMEGNARSVAEVPIVGGAARPLQYERAPSDIDLDARYSPDGSLIAFRRGSNPYSDLYVMQAEGGAVRRVTRLASRIRGFDWMPDGRSLVFSSGHAGPQALYVVSLDDGNVEALGVHPAEHPSSARATDTVVYEIPRLRTQLSRVPLDSSGDVAVDLVPSTGNDGAPMMSPVDERIAFVSDRSGSQQLWLHDPAIGETHALTEADEPNLRYPVWRRDGARLLITARGEGWGHLIEIDLATRRRTILTSGEEDVRYGVYGTSPGRYMAVINADDGLRELVEFSSVDGRATDRRVVARGVGRHELDLAGGAIWFTRVNEPGLFRVDPLTGEEELASSEITPASIEGWLVSGGQLFYIVTRTIGRAAIHRFDPASGTDELLARLPVPVADLNFSISRDRRHVVVVRVAEVDTDIGAARVRPNARAP
jgi:Tol biopolymer transport system component/DNA-binding winged helix-turn-helix (wHTH) protein